MASSTRPSADPALAPFLAPNFSAVDYLNSVLPSWSPSTASTAQGAATGSAPAEPGSANPQGAVSLADLTRASQDLNNRLASSLARLTSTLNSLTDDILRSGGRLAYEVEVLRADVGSLNDVLNSEGEGGLRGEFDKLGIRRGMTESGDVPGEATATANGTADGIVANSNGTSGDDGDRQQQGQEAHDTGGTEQLENGMANDRPEYVRTLHTLTRVRANLDRVITVFGAAMEWAVAPSEVAARSITAVNYTAEGGGGAENEDAEAKGKEYTVGVRDEVAVLLDSGGAGGPTEGIEAAAKRVEELRDLLTVWKGTVEERARSRFVDSLARMVEEERVKRAEG